MPDQKSITRLLQQWHAGDSGALNELTPLVYSELRRLAQHFMNREKQGHTFQTTDLVHEAFINLVDIDVTWEQKSQFFSVAGRQMRRILVDYARGKLCAKRGGGALVLPLKEQLVSGPEDDSIIIQINDALEALAQFDSRKSQAIELTYFAGLSYQETAQSLGISRATLHRDLSLAKAWLYREIKSEI